MISLHSSELQFYQKKIHKLELDLILLDQENITIKTALSLCEDYKLKYQLILTKIEEEGKSRQNRRNQEKLKHQHMVQQLKDKWEDTLRRNQLEHQQAYFKLFSENSQLKEEVERASLEIIQIKRQVDPSNAEILQRKNIALEQDNQNVRKQINQIIKKHKDQINQMEKIYEDKFEEAKDKEKYFYRAQVIELTQKIEKLEIIVQEERLKANPVREQEIEKLKNQLFKRQEENSSSIKKLSLILEHRNEDIHNLFEEGKKKEEFYKQNHQLQQECLRKFEERIFEEEREHQIEIINLRNQLSGLMQTEMDDLKQHNQKIEKQFQLERKQWQHIKEQAEQEVDRVKALWDEEKKKFIEEKNKLKDKIASLKEKTSKQGDSQIGQTEMLIKSLKDIESKEAHFNNYQNSITFLDRQNRKASIKLQEKNREINFLLAEMNQLRTETEQQITHSREKSKKQQTMLLEKIDSLENDLDQLYESLREKEKAIRKKEKEMTEEKQILQKNILSLKLAMEEMERDYNRLTGYKTSIEGSYRQERDNVITGKVDINQEKKKKWVELERQKYQMEIIYKEKQKQTSYQHEVIVNEFLQEISELKAENSRLAQEIERLSSRIAEEGGDASDRSSRMVDYQQKLATLDLEIALSHNLFDTLASAQFYKAAPEFTDQIRKRTQFDQASERESQQMSSEPSFFQMKKREQEGGKTPSFQINIHPELQKKSDKISDFQFMSFHPQSFQ